MRQDERRKTKDKRRGFSLAEVMLAFAILGVGLVMVAAIFPVGATWTRQSVEETIGVAVARNAVAIIQTKYPGGLGVGTTLQALPGIGGAGSTLSLPERAYGFGRNLPYPMTAGDAPKALYFWTALARATPGLANQYDVYIFVFKKGAAEQTFSNVGVTPSSPEFAGTRDASDAPGVPYLSEVSLGNLPMGAMGVGKTTGTVFRKIPSGTAPLCSDGTVLWAPPADGTEVSPLVYVYQTTVGY